MCSNSSLRPHSRVATRLRRPYGYPNRRIVAQHAGRSTCSPLAAEFIDNDTTFRVAPTTPPTTPENGCDFVAALGPTLAGGLRSRPSESRNRATGKGGEPTDWLYENQAMVLNAPSNCHGYANGPHPPRTTRSQGDTKRPVCTSCQTSPARGRAPKSKSTSLSSQIQSDDRRALFRAAGASGRRNASLLQKEQQ